MKGTTFIFSLMSATGFYLLWVLMWQNGTIDAMDKAVRSRRFDDGTALKTEYSGVAAIDHALATLVAFTHHVSNSDNKAAWLLYIDITAAIQTAHMWCLVDSSRKDNSPTWLKAPVIWGLLWHGFGAGIIFPIYVIFRLRDRGTASRIPQEKANALVPAILLACVLPGAAMLSTPLLSRSTFQHQDAVVIVQITPVLAALLHYLVSKLYSIVEGREVQTKARSPILRQTYLLAGLLSAVTHFWVLSYAVSTKESFGSIYLPITNDIVENAGSHRVEQGAKLFLHYDCILIYLSMLVWGYILILQTARLNAVVVAAGLIAGIVALGPGALITAIFYWKESETESLEKSK